MTVANLDANVKYKYFSFPTFFPGKTCTAKSSIQQIAYLACDKHYILGG